MKHVASVIALVLAPVVALAAPSPQVTALRQEVAALKLDRALSLTPEQARAALPLLESARARVDAWKARRAASEPALAAALSQAVADLKATGTVSSQTEAALRAARGNPGELRAEVAPLAQQVRALLTPAQRQALHSFQPWAAAPDGAAGQDAAGVGPQGRGGMGGRMGVRLAIAATAISDPFLALVRARAG